MFIINNKNRFIFIGVVVVLLCFFTLKYYQSGKIEKSITLNNTQEIYSSLEKESIVYFDSVNIQAIDTIINKYLMSLTFEGMNVSSYVKKNSIEPYVDNTGAKGFRVFIEVVKTDILGMGIEESVPVVSTSSSSILFLEGGYGIPNLIIGEIYRFPKIDDSIKSISGFIDNMSKNIPITYAVLHTEAENYKDLSLNIVCSEGVEVYTQSSYNSYKNDMCGRKIVYFSSDIDGFNRIAENFGVYVLNEGLKSKEGNASFNLIATQNGGKEVISKSIIVTVDSYLTNKELEGVITVNNHNLMLNSTYELPYVFVNHLKDRLGALTILKTAIDPRYAMYIIQNEKENNPVTCSSIISCFKQGLERFDFTKYGSLVFLSEAEEKGESNGVIEKGDLYILKPIHLTGVLGVPQNGISRVVFRVREVYDDIQKNAKYVVSEHEIIPYGDKWKLFQ